MSEKAKTQENSTFKEYIYPVVILTVIALVTTLLLAITNNVTTGVIAAKALAAANATRQELLPDADSFTHFRMRTASRRQRFPDRSPPVTARQMSPSTGPQTTAPARLPPW